MRRYSVDSDRAEQEPLDQYQGQYSRSGSRGHREYYNQQQQQQQQPYQDRRPPHQPSPQRSSPTRAAYGPTSHPDSSYRQLQREAAQPPHYAAAGVASSYPQPYDVVSPISPPEPPVHRENSSGRRWAQDDPGYGPPPAARPHPPSNTTPGADNFGNAAAGGMAGIAYTVAERNARESGLEAARGMGPAQDLGYPEQSYQSQRQNPALRGRDPYDRPVQGMQPSPSYGANSAYSGDQGSHSSLHALGAGSNSPGYASPAMRTPSRSPQRFPSDVYSDDPYQGYSRGPNPTLGVVNPHEIEDDGDDGLVYGRRGPRTSMLSIGGNSNRSGRSGNANTAAAMRGGAAAGGVLGGLIGRSGRKDNQYDPVNREDLVGYYGGGGKDGNGNGNGGGSGAGSAYDLGSHGGRGGLEKPAAWSAKPKRNGKKWRIVILVALGVAIVAGVVLGVLFGVVFKNKDGSKQAQGDSADDDTAKNGDLGINSAEIKKIMNNKNLHKIFPGVDYTPLNTQYPDCMHNPPSQNNITRDVAVLSQLTNTVRLYGTDCNQTEMTLHAINRLGLDDTMKVWLGVWQDNNQTTNDRQLRQMWNILDKYGDKPFKGLIVANEILFREQMTIATLGNLLSEVRTNLTKKGLSLPVATSDLGDKWDASLAQASDYIMANIHPFFGGINAKDAAMWTSWFWEDHSKSFFKADKSKNIISETGWPSQGGTDCGTDTTTDCPDASVAGIDQLNQFMEDWVCDALKNGTEYFWFEAFDEPWKDRFNEENKKWEDHWGLMDVNRNLKQGVKIPDCGGKTVGAA